MVLQQYLAFGGARFVKVFIAVLIVFLLSYGLGQKLKQRNVVSDKSIVNVSNCNLRNSECSIRKNDQNYVIKILGEPSALQPFIVYIEVNSEQPDSVFIEFEMKGMDMGHNVYSLSKKDTVWKASVILPVCSLGRNDWMLRVNMKYDDMLMVSEFKIL